MCSLSKVIIKDRVRAQLSELAVSSSSRYAIPVARYAIPVVRDAIPVARDAIRVARDGGNLHLSGTVPYSVTKLCNIVMMNYNTNLTLSAKLQQ